MLRRRKMATGMIRNDRLRTSYMKLIDKEVTARQPKKLGTDSSTPLKTFYQSRSQRLENIRKTL